MTEIGHQIVQWCLAYYETFGLLALIGFAAIWVNDFGHRSESDGGIARAAAMATVRAAGFILAMAVGGPLAVAVMAGALAVAVYPLILIKLYLVDAYWTSIEGAVRAAVALLLYGGAIWSAVTLYARLTGRRARGLHEKG